MNKYNKETRCNKCGETGALTKFIPPKKIYDSQYEMTQAIMKRECKNCGCIWEEEPLDN